MIYRKASKVVDRYSPLCDWGTFSRYLEIEDDSYAVRQVDLFENGYALRYDRGNWIDGCRSLAEMKYDEAKWAAWWGPDEAIAAVEFEAVWDSAVQAPNQPQEYEDIPWPISRKLGE